MVSAIVRWTLAGMARQPWTLAAGALLLAAWPAQRFLAPFTLVAGEGASPDALIEIAYLAILLGAGSTLALWRRGGALSLRASTPRRLVAEALTFLVATSVLELAIWGGAWVCAAESTEVGLERGFLGLQIRKLYLAGWGSLLLRFRLGTAVRFVFLISVAWVLPILFLVQPGLEALLTGVLGMFPPFSAESVRVTKGAVIQALAPIGALWLMSSLLARPGHPRS